MSFIRFLAGAGVTLAALGCSEGDPASISGTSPSMGLHTLAPSGVPVYNVTAIAASSGLRINQSGDVAGVNSQSGSTTPILYTAEKGVIALPTTAGVTYGVARGLSDRIGGVITVVGEAKLPTSGGAIHAVRWTVAVPQGTVLSTTDLGTLPGHSESFANGVNNAGQVTGTSDPNSFLSIRSFLYANSTGMIDLGLGSTGGNAVALDVNNAGVVTGYLNLQAFRWTTSGGLENLGAPTGWANSFGYAINENNQLAGYASNGFGNASKVIRYTNGTGWEILGGMGNSNSGNGINLWGDVVGIGFPRTTSSPKPSVRAVFYSNNLGVLAYLDDLLLLPASWTIRAGYDINDAQQITGYGTSTQTGLTTAVLLTPVIPAPANTPPVANFSYSCNVNFFCGLNGSLSTDDHGIVGWLWTINGQTVATQEFSSIQFNGPQTVNLTLEVTDSRGVTNSITKPLVVGGAANQPPVARFTATCSPGKCILDASTSTDDVGISAYGWKSSVSKRGARTGVQITRVYLASGGNKYQETLTVTDASGLTNAVTKTITVPKP